MKKEPLVEMINQDLIKVTLFTKIPFIDYYFEREIFWKKMGDRNTGKFLFFNKNKNNFFNLKAQIAIEKLIVGKKIYI